MLTQEDLDRISELANNIEDRLNDLDCTSLADLLDEVQSIQSDATELRGLVDDIELDENELGEYSHQFTFKDIDTFVKKYAKLDGVTIAAVLSDYGNFVDCESTTEEVKDESEE